MGSRGPRGDISVATILRAAERLLTANDGIEGISLRGIAAEIGVAVNALYTYFPSLRSIWHDLADERLGLLDPQSLLRYQCPHCGILQLVDRAATIMRMPGTLSLMRAQPVLGPHSFALSETIMALTERSGLAPRDAHDLIVGWFYGSAIIDGEGWSSRTDDIRRREPLESFPRVAGRGSPDRRRQAEAILRGIQLTCIWESEPT